MRLGFPEKVLGEGGLPERDGRRWRSGPHLRVSLEYLEAIFAYLERHDLRMYRVSQALAPYASDPDLPQFHGRSRRVRRSSRGSGPAPASSACAYPCTRTPTSC
ncbi:MAG: hypothetical protein M3P39_06860 [Actinomycetota bacterium]|nr:hypothetical protein [Actinomycetota bacterium]